MPAALKYIIFGIIGLICFIIGVTGNLLYFVTDGKLDGFASTCRMLDVAEQKAILTKDQRKSVAEEAARTAGIAPLGPYLASDCKTSPAVALKNAAK